MSMEKDGIEEEPLTPGDPGIVKKAEKELKMVRGHSDLHCPHPFSKIKSEDGAHFCEQCGKYLSGKGG